MQRKFSIYEAKAKLSELLRMVKSGTVVTITDRGNPVARVVPATAQSKYSLQERLDDLLDMGGIVPASARRFPNREAVPIKFALKTFLAERD